MLSLQTSGVETSTSLEGNYRISWLELGQVRDFDSFPRNRILYLTGKKTWPDDGSPNHVRILPQEQPSCSAAWEKVKKIISTILGCFLSKSNFHSHVSGRINTMTLSRPQIRSCLDLTIHRVTPERGGQKQYLPKYMCIWFNFCICGFPK